MPGHVLLGGDSLRIAATYAVTDAAPITVRGESATVHTVSVDLRTSGGLVVSWHISAKARTDTDGRQITINHTSRRADELRAGQSMSDFVPEFAAEVYSRTALAAHTAHSVCAP